MKKLFLLFTVLSTSLYAQQITNNCYTTGIIAPGTNFNRSTYKTLPYDQTTPYVINAYFTLVNFEDGSNSIPSYNIINTHQQREDQFLYCIKILNLAFNPSNIFFKYTGYQVVENDDINNGNFGGSSAPLTMFLPYKKENAMNFYFINTSDSSFDALPFSMFGGTEGVYTVYDLASHFVLDYQLIHQVGHNLSLYHTYETGSHYPDLSTELTACERVNRIPNSNLLIYNADIAGDEIEDTEAQPITLPNNFLPNCGEYIYDANNQNCFTEPYENITIGNYMKGTIWTTGCRHFTAGQTKRMRKFIQYNSLSYNPTSVPTVRNDVFSLFQPYSRDQIIFPTVLSSSDNGDGTAKVCRGYNDAEFKFQPGFTYEFPENQSPEITTATNQTYPVVVHYPTFNCHVRILELGLYPINAELVNGNALTIDRGQECINEPYILGTIISTLLLGSMNITVDQLNSAQVNDPDLFDNLMNHYFYILKKYTETGTKTEQVFYKQ